MISFDGKAVIVNEAGDELLTRASYTVHEPALGEPGLKTWSGQLELTDDNTLTNFAWPPGALTLRLEDGRQGLINLQGGGRFTGTGQTPA